MTEPQRSPSRAVDYQAAATVVRELFGQSCAFPTMGITLDLTPCGRCTHCRRDWTPEARVIVDAAIGTAQNEQGVAVADQGERMQP